MLVYQATQKVGGQFTFKAGKQFKLKNIMPLFETYGKEEPVWRPLHAPNVW